jgi:RimJ/RimL family protein N-acetyltransferase
MEGGYFLRKVRAGDIYDVYRLSNEDYVRKYSANTKKFDWAEHVVWFENMINSDNNLFYVVTDSTNRFLGQLRYKVENDAAIVSISLCQSITGKGLSDQLLRQSIKFICDEKNEVENIIAFVSEKNIASKKLFEKTGFRLCEKNNGMSKYVLFINKEQLNVY